MSRYFDTQSQFLDSPLFPHDDTFNCLDEYNFHLDQLEALNNYHRSFVLESPHQTLQVSTVFPVDSDIFLSNSILETEEVLSLSKADHEAQVQQFLPQQQRQAQHTSQSLDHPPEVVIPAALPVNGNIRKLGAKSKRLGQKIVTEMTPVVFELIEGAGPRGTTKKHLKAALLEWLPDILHPKLNTSRYYLDRPLRLILTVLSNCSKIYTDSFLRIHANKSASPDILHYRRNLREKAKIVDEKQALLEYLRQQHQSLLHVIRHNKILAATGVDRIYSSYDGTLMLEPLNSDNTLKVGVTAFVVPGDKDRGIWTTDGLKTVQIASKTRFEATTILSKLTERWYSPKP